MSAADAGSRPGPGATALTGFLLRDLRGSLAMRSLWVFSVSLFLGITLIAACTGLLELVRGGLDAQQRLLFGGDVQVEARDVLAPEELDWLEANGTVSRLVELRTMLGTGAGDFTVVELQSVDDAYPLYGDIRLEPDIALADAVGQAPDGTWGAAFDPVLAEQLGVTTGDRVLVGSLSVELRALIREQPDRSFRADFRGPPLMLDEGALAASGLVLPTSVLDYEYRVRTAMDPEDWRDAFFAAFPDAGYEVDTLGERGEFVGEQLDRVASVLLLIGIATLLIGGLGVANSIGAYLQSKFRTLATLQSLGARAAQVSYVFIGQTVLVALAASAAGAFTGSLVAWLAAHALAARLPVTASMADLLAPALTSVLFGVLAALAFALPSLGRTLSMRPALLIRGVDDPDGTLPASYRVATLVLLVAVTLVLLVVVPDPLIGVAFVIAMALLLVALEGIVRLVRRFALWLGRQPALEGRFAARMALAGLHRPGTALRPMLLSLGTALTLLVASSVVIAATLHTLNDTVPSRAPALVFRRGRRGELPVLGARGERHLPGPVRECALLPARLPARAAVTRSGRLRGRRAASPRGTRRQGGRPDRTAGRWVRQRVERARRAAVRDPDHACRGGGTGLRRCGDGATVRRVGCRAPSLVRRLRDAPRSTGARPGVPAGPLARDHRALL